MLLEDKKQWRILSHFFFSVPVVSHLIYVLYIPSFFCLEQEQWRHMTTYLARGKNKYQAFTLIVPERIYRKTGYMKNTVNLDKNAYKYTCTALTFYSSAWLNITLQQWMPFYFKNDQNILSWILIYLFQLSKSLLWQEIQLLGTTCGSVNFSEYMEASIWKLIAS